MKIKKLLINPITGIIGLMLLVVLLVWLLSSTMTYGISFVPSDNSIPIGYSLSVDYYIENNDLFNDATNIIFSYKIDDGDWTDDLLCSYLKQGIRVERNFDINTSSLDEGSHTVFTELYYQMEGSSTQRKSLSLKFKLY